MPAPTPPTPAPKRENVPLDQVLRRDAVSELNRALASNDPILRANAVEGLQRGLGEAAAGRILSALDDKDRVVRFAATMATGTLKLAEAKPRLVTLAADPSKTVQIGARYALHMLGDTRLSHDFEAYAVDPDPRVRANTVMVLGLLGEKSALKIFRGMRNDLNPAVQLQLIEARYRLGDESALEDLAVAAVSKFPDDQIIALLALSATRDERNARLIGGKLTSDYTEVTLAAARSLGMLGVDSGTGVALKAAGSKEPRQRAMAALALGEIRRSDTQSALEKLLKDADPHVRLAAATAILQLGPA
jgi:HEAT repeat protein